MTLSTTQSVGRLQSDPDVACDMRATWVVVVVAIAIAVVVLGFKAINDVASGQLTYMRPDALGIHGCVSRDDCILS